MPDVEVGDELALAGAEEGAVRHQRDFGRQLEALHGLGHLHRIERLCLRCRERAGWSRRKAEPGRAVGTWPPLFLRTSATNSFTCGTFGCFQYHSNTQVPMRASGGRPSSTSSSCCAPARWNFLSSPNCTACLSALTARRPLQEDDDVRVRRLRLDQIGREVGRAERRKVAADLGAAELGGGLFEAGLQGVAESVVGGEVVPLLAGILDQRAGDGVGLHLRRVADAEHVPMAVDAGDGIGVAAGHDVKDLLLDATLRMACAAPN